MFKARWMYIWKFIIKVLKISWKGKREGGREEEGPAASKYPAFRAEKVFGSRASSGMKCSQLDWY